MAIALGSENSALASGSLYLRAVATLVSTVLVSYLVRTTCNSSLASSTPPCSNITPATDIEKIVNLCKEHYILTTSPSDMTCTAPPPLSIASVVGLSMVDCKP